MCLPFQKEELKCFCLQTYFWWEIILFFFWEIKLSFCLFKVLERNATIFLKILPWASKAFEVAAAFKLSKSASLFFLVMILASQKNGKSFWGECEAFFYSDSIRCFFPKVFIPDIWSRLIQIWFWTTFTH